MLNKFIILTTARTGSTFLRLWLNNHPDVRCHGEIFLRHYNAKDGYKVFSEQTTGQKALYHLFGNKLLSRLPGNYYLKNNIKRYFSALYYAPEHSGPWTDVDTWNDFQPYNPRCSCLGFKIMSSTIKDYRILKKFLYQEKYKVIILRRDNVLNTYLSRLSLQNTGLAHCQKTKTTSKLFIDPTKVTHALEKIKQGNESLAGILPNNSQMFLSYEEMFGDLDETMKKLQQFLGINLCSVPQPKLKKVNPTNIVNRIQNYTEVASILSDTTFKKYLV